MSTESARVNLLEATYRSGYVAARRSERNGATLKISVAERDAPHCWASQQWHPLCFHGDQSMPHDSPNRANDAASPRGEGRLLRTARREAIVVFAIWLAAITYTVGYSYTFGYDRPEESITYFYGVPDWVMWGIVLPWAVSTVAAVWFAVFFMTDEPLGDELAPGDDFDVPSEDWGKS